MTGYQETLTDPSYHRQVVVMTSPHVGNTGINDEDPESRRIWVSGYVVRDPSRVPSNWRSARSLDDELRDQGVVGISGIDTRALTRHLRERGAMRVGISSDTADADALLARVKESAEMTGAELAGEVSTAETYVVPAVGREAVHGRGRRPRHQGQHTADDERARHRGARAAGDRLPGRGAGRAAGRAVLLQRARRPGRDHLPGRAAPGCAGRGLPYFGICFGNQLFGRALGFGTYKLKYGHRGINQPVMDRTTGKVEVTAHNHGFAVDAPIDAADVTPYGEVTVSHVCLNDDVVEGLELRRRTGAEELLGAVPPGGGGRPPRRGVPVRPILRLMDGEPPEARDRGGDGEESAERQHPAARSSLRGARPNHRHSGDARGASGSINQTPTDAHPMDGNP